MVDLVILDMQEFNFILEMSWLSPHCVILDCFAKTATVDMPKMEKLECDGTLRLIPLRILSSIYA